MRNDRRTFIRAGLGAVGGSLAAASLWARRRRYTRSEIETVVRDCERRTNDFRKQLDRALDHSSLDGTHREDQLNTEARRLENEIDRVKRELERHEDFMDVRGNVETALDAAGDIDRTMRHWRLNTDAERAWRVLRAELNVLADRYGVRRLR
jgi:hypothetical protein